MPDIRLPNGTILTGVPEGTTKREIIEHLRARGFDVAELLTPPQEENLVEKIPVVGDALAFALDSPLSIASGLTGTLGDLAAVAGPDNAVARFLKDVSRGGCGLEVFGIPRGRDSQPD